MAGTVVEFDALLRDVRAGDQDAIWQLIQSYSSKILRVVRRELPDTLRPRFDSQDFLQVVWASFFKESERVTRFHSPNELAAFLGVVAANKVKMEMRRGLAKKRNANRDRRLDDSEGKVGSTIQSLEPSPEQIAIAKEHWVRMTEDLSDEYRKIVELRLTGSTAREIAQTLGKHEGTVSRAIRKIEAMYLEG